MASPGHSEWADEVEREELIKSKKTKETKEPKKTEETEGTEETEEIEEVGKTEKPKVQLMTENKVVITKRQFKSPQWCYNEFFYGLCRRIGKGCTYCHLNIPICPFGMACAKLSIPGKCDQYHFMTICNEGAECRLYKIAIKLFDEDLFGLEPMINVRDFVKSQRIIGWKRYWANNHAGENYGQNPLLHIINCRHRACQHEGCQNFVNAFKLFKDCGKHD